MKEKEQKKADRKAEREDNKEARKQKAKHEKECKVFDCVGMTPEELEVIKAKVAEEKKIKAEKWQQHLEKEKKAGTKMLYDEPVSKDANSAKLLKYDEVEQNEGSPLKDKGYRSERATCSYHVEIDSRGYIFKKETVSNFLNGSIKSDGTNYSVSKVDGESRQLKEIDTVDGVQADFTHQNKMVFTFGDNQVSEVKSGD